MLRKEDDIKIKCLKELEEMEADTVVTRIRRRTKRNNAIREKDDSLEARRDREKGTEKGTEMRAREHEGNKH